MAVHHPPASEDEARAIDHYAALAADLGPKLGYEGGGEAASRLSAETANIERMLLLGLNGPEPRSVIEAAIAFVEFQRFSGLGTVEGASRAVEVARSLDDSLAAQALRSLGAMALQRSDHDGARAHYEAALPLFRRVDDVRGEATCIFSLGDIARRRSNHDGARERYEEALPLFRRVGDVLGEANCIFSLGDIALARSDHGSARERYEEALPLFRRVGAVLGEANCIFRLGDIALRRSDHDGARERYEEALPLFRRVDDMRGEANCIASLGDIALRRSDHDGARERYMEALGLYSRIPHPYSIGQAHKRLADVARDEDERARHIAAAREAWLSIKRDDLVQRLDQTGRRLDTDS